VSTDPSQRILGSAFGGDDGTAPAALRERLLAYATGQAGYAEVLAELLDARVMVPVLAVAGEVEVDDRGLAHDKTADMATVLVTGADGRQAYLAFTAIETLAAWPGQARPVPVSFRDAARAALQDGAVAVVVDLAGPVPFAVEGQDLEAAARGYTLGTVGESSAWLAPPG
jgi:hypothetical protein